MTMATAKKKAKPLTVAGVPSAVTMRKRSKDGRKNCVVDAMNMAADGGNLTVQLFDQQAPLDAELTTWLRAAGYEVNAQQAYKDPDGNAKWVVTISWS